MDFYRRHFEEFINTTCSSSFEEVFLSFEEGISSSLKWWVDCPIKLFQRIICTGGRCAVVSL